MNAFGIEDFSKKKTKDQLEREIKRNNRVGSAIAGSGGVVMATGLAAGGVPGAKSFTNANSSLKARHRAPTKPASNAARKVANSAMAAPGGIFGYRNAVHGRVTSDFDAKAKAAAKATKDASESYAHGHHVGKIPPEMQVMRGMKRARRVSNALMLGGAGLVAYGVDRRKVSKAYQRDKVDTYNAALAGAGGTGTALTHVVPKYLDKHKRRYSQAASLKVDQAQKLVPGLGGRKGKTMYPEIPDYKIKSDPSHFKGADAKKAGTAGRLRGAAAQERHFAEVFGSQARGVRAMRTPFAIAGTVGAGGLILNRKKKPTKVSKSAFGIDHETSR